MNTTHLLTLALMIAPLHSLAGQEFVVTQKDKAFSTKALTIKAGDKVVFKNDDSFSHNIFSLTDAQPFDLGTFGNGQSKSVIYAKPGKYEVECAIHPDMRLIVTVTP